MPFFCIITHTPPQKTDRIVTEANQTTSISISLTEELKELQLSLVEAQTEGSDQDLSDLKKSIAAKMKRIEEAANSNIAKVERLQKEADLTEAALKSIVSRCILLPGHKCKIRSLQVKYPLSSTSVSRLEEGQVEMGHCNRNSIEQQRNRISYKCYMFGIFLLFLTRDEKSVHGRQESQSMFRGKDIQERDKVCGKRTSEEWLSCGSSDTKACRPHKLPAFRGPGSRIMMLVVN